MLELIAAALAGRRYDGPAGDVDMDMDVSSARYATASGTVYHRSDCAVIAHHPDDLRVLGPDGRAGMRPCQICSAG